MDLFHAVNDLLEAINLNTVEGKIEAQHIADEIENVNHELDKLR